MDATDDPTTPLPAGWVPVEQLARVPMRLTVLAERPGSGERAVVVVPAPEVVEHVEQRDRLRRHADAVAALNHPHILPLRVVDDSAKQLLTGVPPGVELAALIPGASPPAGFLPVLAGIADALDAARRVGCYHGDLSAEDVLIDLRTGHACLSGFGVSPAAESADDGATLDVEELGSLLVQCIDGLPPTGAPPPPGLTEVLDRAATEDPALLYPSCRAMIDAAAAILLPPPPAAHRPAPEPRKTRRFGLLIGSVLAVVLLLIASVVGGPWVLSRWSPTSAELARMPATVRVDCDVAEPTGPVPNASRLLRCTDLAGQELIAGLYDSVPDAEAGYRAAATPGARTGDGDCAASPGWEHVYPGVGAPAGRVLCVRDGSGARMVWLDRANRTVSTATRADGNAVALYQAWARWVQIPEFPTPLERALRDQLVQPTCRRAPAGSLDQWDGVTAALDCTQPGDGTTSVRYLQFSDVDHLQRAYRSALDSHGIRGTATCAGTQQTGFLGDDLLDVVTQDYGRLACTPGDGTPTVIWTAEPLSLLGIATGTDPMALSLWWLVNGRPKPQQLIAALGRGLTPAFPNPDEASVIQQLPRPAEKYCSRPTPDVLMSLFGELRAVSVACYVQVGYGSVFYSRYADRAELAQAVGPGGGADCTTNPPGFRGSARYTGPNGATGVLTCATTDRGMSFLDWSDERTGIRATLAGDSTPADKARMIAWWKANVN